VIGIIAHVDEQFSLTRLFTTPGFEATTYVVGSNIVATLEGVGGGIARVRVPQGIPLTVGSLVYIPSIQPGVFGRITFVESAPTQPEQYGYISPDKAISSLQYVAVGRQPLQSLDTARVMEQIESLAKDSLVVDGMNTTTIEILDEVSTSTEEVVELNDE
jgi:hypothetical protein